jgi:alpha-N-arabinofuranosidase
MNELRIDAGKKLHKINKNIYGHFSENIGKNIYGGFWVGDQSTIPAINGIRSDIIDALKKIRIPVLRWPGGCFADTYHWRDGIGPRNERPVTLNSLWGEKPDNNHFGTHEFLDLCETLGCDAYINCNVGSGSVQETREWIEYVNCDKETDLVNLRRRNGREKPWNIKYIGIGNENWGCGGNMSASYYTSLYKQYQTYIYNYGGNNVYKIAGGPSYSSIELPDFLSHDVAGWIDTLMRDARYNMNGLSIHYYVMPGDSWENKGSALNFDDQEWFTTMRKVLDINTCIENALSIMDRHDPDHSVDLLVDEWGTFYACECGNCDERFWGYDGEYMVFQQNSLRDALAAALTLNIYNHHSDRIHMANLSMTVNQLQSLILTRDENMILTPTYHVFDLFQSHQNSMLLQSELECESYSVGNDSIPALSASASWNEEGFITVSLCNLDPHNKAPLQCRIKNGTISGIEGKTLTSSRMNDHNSFENPENVGPVSYTDFETKDDMVMLTVDPKSVTVLTIH